MSAESFLRWFPVAVTVLQLLILPLLVIALNSQIDRRIERHNDNLYAHPALKDLKELEGKIDKLGTAVAELRLAIERISPRRRAGDDNDALRQRVES